MKRFLLLFFLLSSISLYAKAPSFKEIKAMPKSYAKDYYSWRFILEKNTKKQEAIKAYKWTKRKSPKLRKAIRKKIGYVPQIGVVKKKKDSKNFIIYPSTASKKSLTSLRKLYKKIKKQGKYSDVLKVMTSKNPFKALALSGEKTQAYVFNGVTWRYRKRYFNRKFSKKQLKKLIKVKQFNQSIHKIVTTHSLKNLKKSLLLIEDNNLTFHSNFLLAMNAIELNNKKKALAFLKIAKRKAYHQHHYDQINFWNYLITKNKKYLKKLKDSHQVNIYTLKARDILKIPYPKVITPHLAVKKLKHFNIENPIDWEKIKIEMKRHPNRLNQLANKYKSHDTEGIYSYLKEKASKYKVPYYPMPYSEAMWGFPKKRVTMLYALGRQESRFIPASVSSSYALGMMQIMPFLIKHLAKERKKKIDLDDMFNPHTAISYANQHLNYLNRRISHPLLVAYAYNGGIGYTRRILKRKHLFKNKRYEPFLSMELIDSIETREYGKKVLTNYVIYSNLLKNPVNLSALLDKLKHLSRSDRFQK